MLIEVTTNSSTHFKPNPMFSRKRVVVAGLPHHVTQRGNNRMQVFHNDDDFLYCIDVIRDAAIKHECQIHSYVLMSNHLHILATPQAKDGLSKMMQSVELKYVRYYNKEYKRTGTLWEGRYGSSVVESGNYFFTVSRYIELNPVRAFLSPHPAAYRWSSFHSNALGTSDPLITPHSMYSSLDTDGTSRRMSYISMFAGHLDEDVCSVIRNATRKRSVIGSDAFVDEVEKNLKRIVRPAKHGGKRVCNSKAAGK